VAVELVEGTDDVVIRVIDNGVGVPEGFDVRSSGLGLSIVAALVTSDLRGTLDVCSPPEGPPGTMVQLRIPVDPFAAA